MTNENYFFILKFIPWHVCQIKGKKIKRKRNWGIITTSLKQNYYGMHVMVDIYYESSKQQIMWMVEMSVKFTLPRCHCWLGNGELYKLYNQEVIMKKWGTIWKMVMYHHNHPPKQTFVSFKFVYHILLNRLKTVISNSKWLYFL